MSSSIKIPNMIIRASTIIILLLGVLIWTGVGDNQTVADIHIAFGILIVLSLWVMAFSLARMSGSYGLAIGAVIYGILMYIFGITQANILLNAHWIIQIAHLLVGLIAIGFAEMIGASAKKLSAAAK